MLLHVAAAICLSMAAARSPPKEFFGASAEGIDLEGIAVRLTLGPNGAEISKNISYSYAGDASSSFVLSNGSILAYSLVEYDTGYFTLFDDKIRKANRITSVDRTTSGFPATKYVGYTLDASTIDTQKDLYHAVLVNFSSSAIHSRIKSFPHRESRRSEMLSDQSLVTINLREHKIVGAVGVDGSFSGPLVVDNVHGLLTFGSETGCAIASVDWKTGKQTCLIAPSGFYGLPMPIGGGVVASDGFVSISQIEPPYHYSLIQVDLGVNKSAPAARVIRNTTMPIALTALSILK
eukprot:jgi/Bigna1/70746/fgenesh1_pg.13_\